MQDMFVETATQYSGLLYNMQIKDVNDKKNFNLIYFNNKWSKEYITV